MYLDPLALSPGLIKKMEKTSLDRSGNFAEILAQEQKQLKKACQELEAFFVQQVFKQLRATVPESELLPKSMGEKLYEEMLDAEYSKIIAESPHGFGLAEMLYEQLKERID
jgi:flagellar protein FlgJ